LKLPKFSWPGVVAIILALGISTALIVGIVSAELTKKGITQAESNLLSTLGGASVGAVATYLGIAINGNGKNGKEKDE